VDGSIYCSLLVESQWLPYCRSLVGKWTTPRRQNHSNGLEIRALYLEGINMNLITVSQTEIVQHFRNCTHYTNIVIIMLLKIHV
jgi:hypothetical protein